MFSKLIDLVISHKGNRSGQRQTASMLTYPLVSTELLFLRHIFRFKIQINHLFGNICQLQDRFCDLTADDDTDTYTDYDSYGSDI